MLDNNQSVVIALGYFDSVHKGHRKVIANAYTLAQQLNAKPIVFTFEGNLKGAISGKNEKSVYSLEERKIILNEMGVKEIYCAPVNKDFLSLSAKAFLDKLNLDLKIAGYVTGDDYRFGDKGCGDVEFLRAYAKANGQQVMVTNTQTADGLRISTSLIKELLSSGDIKKANYLLDRNYSITGEVVKDRRVGTKLGFPTVNVEVEKEKHLIKNGVYYGKVDVKGRLYKAIINYGARPTFNLKERVLEAHLIDFDGDLYGQTLTIYFEGYLRDIKAFNDSEALKNQLEKDLLFVKQGMEND